MDIGEIIRERRLQLGMTQTELARRLRISRNQVSNLETGKSDPSAKVFACLEEALEASLTELLANPLPSQVVWLSRRDEPGREEAFRGGRELFLAAGPGQRLTPLRVRLSPGMRWEPGCRLNDCSEHFIYVLSGTVEGLAAGRWAPLPPRHGVYVKGDGPRVWRNASDEEAEFLWIGGE